MSDEDVGVISLSDSDFSVSSPVSKPTQRGKAARKPTNPLSTLDSNAVHPIVGGKKAKSAKKKKDKEKLITGDEDSASLTIEQIYQKKTQLEHILLRPDTYVGSIEPVTQQIWVFSSETKKMEFKKITYVPGLYKIFDEIIVNACDNKQRDSSMNTLRVNINQELGEISVWNNGKGIPIARHKEHHVYVPELIFGHLLTGSNFDDKKKKTTGGRNGYGAKLANIFSTQFIVETADVSVKQRYKQVFSGNMSKIEEPVITSWSKKDYTCITFRPDLKRFKMQRLDDDIVALFKKRVYDIAGVTDKSLHVHLNDEQISVKSFPEYIELYQTNEAKDSVIFDKPTERWQVGIGLSDDGFQQISFVNGICTTKGGQHVNYIADQVVSKLVNVTKKKNKGEAVRPNYIKNMMTVYVTALIDNPAFDSQTKETLTTRPASFGSTYTLSDKFLKQIEKSGIVERILSFAQFKQTAELQRKGGSSGKRSKLTGIVKLDDANYAGTTKAKDCTLILTEGDSAKSLTIGGLSVVGRDYYGVFPLKGKLLNVREASHSQILKNEEIQSIVKILGLKYGQTYDSAKGLRYGHLMVMADQDHDGSHIKGLVINFIHHFWPSLLKIEGFMHEFITPIVKCTKGNMAKVFYTIPEYESWKAASNNGQGWKIKYYKGLGTSTTQEAKGYFSDLPTHQIDFSYECEQDGDSIDMAFSKKRVEERKDWLRGYQPGTHVDYKVDYMPYSEFVNKELILFSRADNMRSIPCIVDGFKPSQRKVLYCCFKRNLKTEIKVAQLAGYVSEHSAYHHGEASLHGTIVNMAQDFVGSNNINLLSPNGQFGTRIMGGKDAASPRYIFTKLETVTQRIYDPKDNCLLNYLDEDGQSIEPEWYVPIIPMVLVNGSEGIGTGWSSSIPNYNPFDLIGNLRLMLEGKDMLPLKPWYRGYAGSIEEKSSAREGESQSFIVRGVYECETEDSFMVTELPIKVWTQSYKQFLESLIEANTIKDFKENHTDAKVSFTIYLTTDKMQEVRSSPGGIMKKFKLESSISASNMHLFDASGRIKKYDSPLDIMREFYVVRLEHYSMRKEAMLRKLEEQINILANKVRFILAVIRNEIKVSNRKKLELLSELVAAGYAAIDQKRKEQTEEDEEEQTEEVTVSSRGYDYLMSMPIWSLTKERIDKLQEELHRHEEEHRVLSGKSVQELWLSDLEDLEQLLLTNEEQRVVAAGKAIPVKKNVRRRVNTKKMNRDPDFESKPKPKPKRQIKSIPKTLVQKKLDNVSKEELSLSERLALRAEELDVVKPKADDSVRNSQPDPMFSDDDIFILENPDTAKSDLAPKTQPRAKRKAADHDKAAKRTKAIVVSELDDSEDDEATARPVRRGARSRNPVTYGSESCASVDSEDSSE